MKVSYSISIKHCSESFRIDRRRSYATVNTCLAFACCQNDLVNVKPEVWYSGYRSKLFQTDRSPSRKFTLPLSVARITENYSKTMKIIFCCSEMFTIVPVRSKSFVFVRGCSEVLASPLFFKQPSKNTQKCWSKWDSNPRSFELAVPVNVEMIQRHQRLKLAP